MCRNLVYTSIVIYLSLGGEAVVNAHPHQGKVPGNSHRMNIGSAAIHWFKSSKVMQETLVSTCTGVYS